MVLESILEDDKPTLVTGDFNVCLRQNPNNAISSSLMNQGFIQMVEKASHVKGGWIDHAYWRDNGGNWDIPAIETYSPYYSDHDSILVTLKKVNS